MIFTVAHTRQLFQTLPQIYRVITVAQKYKSIHSTTPSSSTLLFHSFTPLQNPFTRRPQFPSLHCKIPSLDAPRFLHSTEKFLYSTPPDSSTPLQNSSTPRFRVSLSSVCPASAGSRNCHLTVTRVTHYACWRVRCMFLDGEC